MNVNLIRSRILKPFRSIKNKQLKRKLKLISATNQLYEQTAEEISDYTGETVEYVKTKHREGPYLEPTFDIFKQQSHLTKDNVEKFYQDCRYYIYELPLWNAETLRPRQIATIVDPYLKQNSSRSILDFGGGTGDLCIEFANMGYQCNYCDISLESIKFAQWRFQQRKLNIPIFEGLSSLSNQQFDSIVSYDVFEHLKDLDKVLFDLVKSLKDGGLLCFSGAFDGGLLHLEENDKYDQFQEMDALMNKCGLVFQDKFAQYFFYCKRFISS